MLPDDVTAQKQAIRLIQELKADEPDWRGYTMEVPRRSGRVGNSIRDGIGRPSFTVTIFLTPQGSASTISARRKPQ